MFLQIRMAFFPPHASTVQNAAASLLTIGLAEFRNVSVHILRDCDTVQSLIALQALGKTNASIVQELINLGVGTGSLQSTLQGVFKNLTSGLSAQSTSVNIPTDCIVQADNLDDIHPSDPRFTAWLQKCGQYATQWAAQNAAHGNQDWAKASNVRATW